MSNQEQNAKILERVRALLAKANDPSIGNDEADLLRGKADEMMAKYALSQWQVDQAQKGVGQSASPEQRAVDISWYWDASGSHIRDYLWSMMNRVADHCRVVIAVRGYNEGRFSANYMPVIGLPSDIDYFDMLFTDLMLQLGMRLTPSVDPKKTWIENLVVMKEAGMNWKPIADKLIASGQIEGPWIRSLGVKFTKVYADYCAQHGKEQLKITPRVFQQSFAKGFSLEVGNRLYEMRTRQESEDSSGSMALAVIDLKKRAEDLYFEMYPPTARNTRGSVVKEKTINAQARAAGVRAGSEANISGHQGRRVGSQGALDA